MARQFHDHSSSFGRPDVPLRMCLTLNDFEEFAATVQDWNLETTLLSRGRFLGHVWQQVGPGHSYQIGRARYSKALRQVGESPPGMRTFAIPASRSMVMDWRRRPTTAGDLLLFPPGGELDGVTRAGFDVFTVSVPQERLDSIADACGMATRWRQIMATEVFPRGIDTVQTLRRALEVSTSMPDTPGMHPAPPIDMDEIVRLILNVLIQPDAKSPRPTIPCLRQCCLSPRHMTRNTPQHRRR